MNLLINGVAGETQMALGDFFDGQTATNTEVFGGGVGGMTGTIALELTNEIPIVGPALGQVADDIVRTIIVETISNVYQNDLDQKFDSDTKTYYSY